MTFEMVNARYLNFNTKQKILKLEEAQVWGEFGHFWEEHEVLIEDFEKELVKITFHHSKYLSR